MQVNYIEGVTFSRPGYGITMERALLIAPSNMMTQPLVFSLREIASWTPGVCDEVPALVRARVPALQRGLVWSPQQNELLWDSILRGFPIGSVVVTRWSDKLKKTGEAKDDTITHHLLDGQQRCHAIALGFSDPFFGEKLPGGKEVESILWLDLKPKFDRNGTRNFLVRATTTAHPWGYQKDDEATRLVAREIRGALEPLKLDAADPDYRRPTPKELWPCGASADTPVPLAWLMRPTITGETIFWSALEQRAAEATEHPWAERVLAFCADPAAAENKLRIFKGIMRAHAARLIALEAPEELLEVSEQERASGSDREEVSNIEHLFQRLNRQGTRLDGEELAYSMIKAYWPDLEKPINEVSRHRMPQARMISLGVRAALAKDTNRNLPAIPTVGALRVIARTERNRKGPIQDFITKELRGACELVDRWLKYDPATNRSGLLPVHVTGIAINSREVYLLLLYLAKRMRGIEAPEDWPQTMQGLATVLHWFAVDKTAATNRVYAACRGDISFEPIRTALREAIAAGDLHLVHSPNAIEAFVQVPEARLENWNWRSLIHEDGSEEEIELRQKTWDGFLGFRSNTELLLYAQRRFVGWRFRDYDPARRDLWDAHDRPWDYDHILASRYYVARKDNGAFREVCREWGNTIGNLRAWPFEDNRSDQDTTAKDKIKGDVTCPC